MPHLLRSCQNKMNFAPPPEHRLDLMKHRVAIGPSVLLLVAGVLESALIAAPPLARGIPDREKEAACAMLQRYLRDGDGVRGAARSGDARIAFEINASLPRLKKYGILRGLKLIAAAGPVAFTQLKFVGDDLIK